MMLNSEYRSIAERVQKETAKGLAYLIPGLAAEAGEVAGKYAKALRDGLPTREDRDLWELSVAQELGDVLWFVDRIADNLGYTLADLQQLNVNKLLSRQKRGTIEGSGDDR